MPRWFTLLIFSPCKWGISSLNVWNPALMLCILLRSFEFAICLRSFLSAGRFCGGSSEADALQEQVIMHNDKRLSIYEANTLNTKIQNIWVIVYHRHENRYFTISFFEQYRRT